jgi:hypothetical protein
MDQRARHEWVIREAAQTVGSQALSGYLGVEAAQVERWLSGAEPVPLPAFIGALDLIADGPYAGRRAIRVAAIKV